MKVLIEVALLRYFTGVGVGGRGGGGGAGGVGGGDRDMTGK